MWPTWDSRFRMSSSWATGLIMPKNIEISEIFACLRSNYAGGQRAFFRRKPWAELPGWRASLGEADAIIADTLPLFAAFALEGFPAARAHLARMSGLA